MNKINIFLAPVFALFSRRFYNQVLQSSVGLGFLYLFYLAGLFTISLLLYALLFIAPQTDRFVDWAKKTMPPLVWTPAGGLQMDAKSPYPMVHPEFGPIVTFDMTQEQVDPQKMGDVRLLVTAKRIYYRERPAELRVIDITRPAAANPNVPQSLKITPEAVQTIYDKAKPLVFSVTLIILWIFFYLAQLFLALAASLVGLGINFFRTGKLKYSAILNASLFAVTASVGLEIVKIFLPFSRFIPSGFFSSLFLTSVYLFLAVKLTETYSIENPSPEEKGSPQ